MQWGGYCLPEEQTRVCHVSHFYLSWIWFVYFPILRASPGYHLFLFCRVYWAPVVFPFRRLWWEKGLPQEASPSLSCFSSALFKAFLFSIQIRFADCPERGKTHFTHLTDLAFDPLISTKLQKDRLKCSTVLPSRIFQGQCGSPFVRHSTVRVLGKITCI